MSSQPQQVALSDLDLNQLADVKRQLEEELNHLSNSYTQLKQAQGKFVACIENVAELKPENKDKVILVPLTNSLYVPGKLSDPEHVIVDIGTGYFVQKTRKEATKYYAAKVEYIRTNLDTLEESLSKKRDNVNYVVNVIQSKLQNEAAAKNPKI
ncbi:Prefoldin alpha subunit [Mycena floridula]|nr:Prefoldin alpha subunit [Mycena floridula]